MVNMRITKSGSYNKHLKDKASVEMEARQHQRIIEETSAYDGEEMDIVQEILMRREKEKLFLEREVEAYRVMVSQGNEQSTGNFSDSNDATHMFSPQNDPNHPGCCIF